MAIDGLVSGLDTASIIQQLMKIERFPQDLLALRQNKIKAASEAQASIRSKLQDVSTAAAALSTASKWNARTATSTDPKVATVSATSTAAIGSLTFPVDQTAKDVVAILQKRLDEVGVETRLNTPVLGIERDENGVKGVWVPRSGHASHHVPTPDENLVADRAPAGAADRTLIGSRSVVIAVGGSSYPKSGTTGDAYPWAESLGHTIKRVRAALAPIALHETKWREYTGVALRDCVLKARQNGKEVARWRDDLLFTHFGISGPTALGVSREVAEAFENGKVEIEVDVLPDRTFESLTDGVLGYAEKHPKRRIATRRTSVCALRNSSSVAASSQRFTRGSDANSGRASASDRNR